MDTLKFLCSADLHIGRLPGSLPEHVDARSVSPASVWRRFVQLAIEEQADAVLLSGDLIDRANRFFEALGPMEDGVRQLADHGIPVIATAGNHDFDVLPRLASTLAFHPGDDDPHAPIVIGQGGFHLLGTGGRWQRRLLVKNGRPVVAVDGWSFPEAHWGTDPLESLSLIHQLSSRSDDARESFPVEGADLPAIGIVHGDLYASESSYAPLSRDALMRSGHVFWLLGHIHKMDSTAGDHDTHIVYPGSLQALDAGETGPHGAFVVTVKREGAVHTRPVYLATVRYENVQVDLTDVTDVDEAIVRFTNEVRAVLADAVRTSFRQCLRHLVLRVRLTGRSPAWDRIEPHIQQAVASFHLTDGDATAHVERVTVHADPHYDLVQLADGSGAPAVLARLLLGLQQVASHEGNAHPVDTPTSNDARAVRSFLSDVRARLTTVQNRGTYNALHRSGGEAQPLNVDDNDLIDLTAQQCMRLLDALTAQKSPHGDGIDDLAEGGEAHNDVFRND